MTDDAPVQPSTGSPPLEVPFLIDDRFRPLLAVCGIRHPDDAGVTLDDERLRVRFGFWSLSTPARNLAGAQLAGPFHAVKAIGPRLSFADRGVTFGTSTGQGACIRFVRPVPGLEPLGALLHPGVTVTVRDPAALVDAVERRAERNRERIHRRPEPTAPPSAARRAVAILRYPAGLALTTVRYLRSAHQVDRSEGPAHTDDLPPTLPEQLVDAHVKTIGEGAGPLLHRDFRVRIRSAGLDAADLVDLVCADLDRAAPSEVVSFRKVRGRVGELRIGDEYVVRMPAPWSGPVRVVHRDETSFRFATLAGHLEAGQIQFSARARDGAVEFSIESWARPGDGAAAIVFDTLRIGKEIQLHMWTQFCLTAATLAGGQLDGPVRVRTRRAPWPPPEPA